jgi:uncharacterized membrane protein
VRNLLKNRVKMIKLRFPKAQNDSAGKRYQLDIELITPEQSKIVLTANEKAGLVESVNANADDKTNVIYRVRYDNGRSLRYLYVCICLMLMVFVVLGYVLLVVKRVRIERAYVCLALVLGVIFNVVITVHGVPDEPGHIDTAYRYSNQLLGISDTGNSATIYKRVCDVVTGDQLVNGVETNSYYMLEHELFDFANADERALVEVSYVNAGWIVPGIIYLPATIGISIGRLLHGSYFMVIMLGRMCNLLAFVGMMYAAICFLPYGKNMMACIGLLPITLQEASSISYDAVINGILLLFVAQAVYLASGARARWWNWTLAFVLTVLLALLKGGVYLPLMLLFYLVIKQRRKKPLTKPQLGLILALAMMVFAICLVKFLPMVTTVLSDNGVNSDGEGIYSLAYVLRHPVRTVYLAWNTIVTAGDAHLLGLFGGLLSWVDVRINWFLVILLMGCLFLLAHVETDTRALVRRERIVYGIVVVCVVGLVALSMLISFTPVSSHYIQGIQGRYYLGILPLAVYSLRTGMLHVKQEQVPRVWLTVLLTLSLMVVRFVTIVVA